ncbi:MULTISPECIES: ABC transporter permease [Bacillaceae]|uniref:ABC3 transporter permease C-terminal domain-containing protein n=1 Tax=Gottfriedia luciferensis TaxID=178774 RepID=A0ABX2ZTY8_9BACI|nr:MULTISPECIES: ABC transporter permease [Bacillaceae]ODG92651.1 hypothetical protein BED47_18355 [Gottfriedia luciferensis]SFC38441.1 FtsX-like permease family protein [Bacillus sp. UNCCL81]
MKTIYKKPGQRLNLVYTDSDSGKETALTNVTIANLTDQFPIGVSSVGLGGLNLIVSEPVMNKLISLNPNGEVNLYYYLKSKDPMKTQQDIENMKSSKMQVNNRFQTKQQQEQLLMLLTIFTYGFITLITLISVANIFNTISTSVSLRKREFAMLKSVGMTPKGFNKMIHYESIFYGIKSLLIGLPISIVIMYLIHLAMMNTFSYNFTLPWMYIFYCFTTVFIIVSSTMLFSSAKIKKENIIDALKQESI